MIVVHYPVPYMVLTLIIAASSAVKAAAVINTIYFKQLSGFNDNDIF